MFEQTIVKDFLYLFAGFIVKHTLFIRNVKIKMQKIKNIKCSNCLQEPAVAHRLLLTCALYLKSNRRSRAYNNNIPGSGKTAYTRPSPVTHFVEYLEEQHTLTVNRIFKAEKAKTR